jgi:monoamine oxidase
MRYDVVVIGGGVAGLAAAGRLAQAGRKVILLEARARLGGRIHTVLDPALRHPVELGAEFVQGSPPEFLQVIQSTGLLLQEIPERHERSRGGVDRPFPPVDKLADRLLRSTGSHLPDVPVAQLIREQVGSGFTSDELEALRDYLEGFHGADLERFGTAALAENQATESSDGERLFRVAGGYGELVSRLASLLDSNLAEVRTEAVVTRLHWQSGTVVVAARTADGAPLEVTGSQAILAVPLGTLKASTGAEGAVRLDPLPPGWEKALGCLEVGAAQRVDLRFETAWWIEQNRPAPIFVHGGDEPFPVWWTTSPPELPFLTAWAGGPRAVALAGRSQEELVRLALLSASSIFGLAVGTLDGWLRAAYYHDWSNDPFARGAYSYGGVGASAAREALRRPAADTLFLTGEAIAAEGRNATVPGALIGGLRTAETLLRSLI